MITPEDVQDKLKPLIEAVRLHSITPEYQAQATDDEIMGLIVSKFFEWDGLAILKTAYNALEDANFHTENLTIERMITRLEERAQVQE